MTLSSSIGDSTMTPPATPTSPRLNTLPIRNPHTASSANDPKHPRALPSHSINTALPERNNSPPYTSTTKMDPTSAFVHTSPDGVWENSTPYTIMHEAPLGAGLWSSVYLASPIYTPMSPSETPPATPVRRRGQSNSVSSTDSYTTQFSSSTASSTCITRGQETSGSAIWAIKAPADRAAFSVIRSEARMLTHIFSHTSPTTHMVPYMVPFLGLDPRTGGVLMHALPLTLDDFIRGDLASLPEKQRTQTVASLFPQLAAKLLIGLEWLHEEAGIVHADIKPSNILLRPTSPGMTKAMLQQRMRRASLTEDGPLERPSLLLGHNDDDGILLADFEPLYTDFSAAFPIHPSLPPFATSSRPTSPAATTPPPPPPNHLAGGTWDFLAPELCHRLHDGPSPASDVYALGVTLLCFVLGESPFEAVAGGNAFRKREMVKVGDAVGFAKGAGRGGRFARVGAEVEMRVLEQGWSWEKWLRRGLTKDAAGRVGAGEWRRGLEAGGLA